MRSSDYNRDAYDEYTLAMVHVSRSLRQGRMADVKQWLAIAERLLKLNGHLDEIRLADDKREAWRAEQPHRLKVLQHRAHFGR